MILRGRPPSWRDRLVIKRGIRDRDFLDWCCDFLPNSEPPVSKQEMQGICANNGALDPSLISSCAELE